jgi:hypothetical protein
MKLNQIRDVVAIADRGSLRAAAQHLRLAQPALTRQHIFFSRGMKPLLRLRCAGYRLRGAGCADSGTPGEAGHELILAASREIGTFPRSARFNGVSSPRLRIQSNDREKHFNDSRSYHKE